MLNMKSISFPPSHCADDAHVLFHRCIKMLFAVVTEIV